jgi:Asp-tRNA(Asn)/Glu-tRNA(Gln) amidotransferase A subunit family amidase
VSRTAGEELAFTSATALATAIRTGALSPVEVMGATLARIEARNPGLRPQAVVGTRSAGGATGRVRRVTPFVHEGGAHAQRRHAALGLTVLMGPDPCDPFCARDVIDPLEALGRDIAGMRIAYSPDLDVFPVDPRIAEVVASAVRAFDEAGAHVEEVSLGLRRDQRELSDAFWRLILPATTAAVSGLRRRASISAVTVAETAPRGARVGSTSPTA